MSAFALRPCVRSASRAGHGRVQAWLVRRPTIPSIIEVGSDTTARHHSTDNSPFTAPTTSSVSASEVSHFASLASSWWDPHGPSRLLHLMNPLRHDFIRSCLQSSADPEDQNKKHSYLDIGCGGGIFASSAARLPNTSNVAAIDPTESVIAVAQNHQRSDPALNPTTNPGKLTYLNCAIEQLSSHLSTTTPQSTLNPNQQGTPTTEQSQYDIITLFEVLEHISQPSSFLRLCLPYLKPGGWLIGSTISRHPVSYLTTKLVAEAPWPFGVVPKGTHDWDKFIKPRELSGWFEQENRRHNGDDTMREGSGQEKAMFGRMKIEGVVYFPVMGWKVVPGSEEFGNYFFGIQKLT